MNEMQHQWKKEKKTELEDLQENIFHRAGATWENDLLVILSQEELEGLKIVTKHEDRVERTF